MCHQTSGPETLPKDFSLTLQIQHFGDPRRSRLRRALMTGPEFAAMLPAP
jgi:hypothetical protein